MKKEDKKKSETVDFLLAASPVEIKEQKETDYFELFKDFPKLPLDELFVEPIREEANRRINKSGVRLHSQDNLKRAVFSVLELCAEKYMMEQIIARDREKIIQLEERQKKMNETLKNLLKRMEDFALKIHIEK